MIPIRYGHTYWGTRYHVNISVYQGDGSVAVAHGGIEMGQGINTKVAQVVAKELGVELDMVRVKPSSNFANVNGSVTGGGMGSECNCSVCLIDCLTLKVLIKFGVRGFLDDVPLDPFG